MDKVNLPGKGQGIDLPLVERFYTIQGEGFHTGKAAYFIRIGGCDIGCRWCDSKVSWNPGIHKMVSVNDIVQAVLETPARSVVVTGGEPSYYNLNPLCEKLKEHGIETFVETAGANNINGVWDWICLSPKTNQNPHEEMFKRANELKVIIYEEKDFEWAQQCAEKVSDDCYLFLQPEWSRYAVNIEPIVNFVKENPRWMISLQSHKFMRIP